MKPLRFFASLLLAFAVSAGFHAMAAESVLTLTAETSALDEIKGVRLFSDDFATKDT